MRNHCDLVIVCAETHVFVPHKDLQRINLRLVSPFVASQKLIGVLKSGGKSQYC